ncbi:B12-binding domain-containing radical SAM protein [Tepidibacillus marianensis]|uniref:B12-binding domain-containing radical SAM protein n=1 Tax=Tepidibacillus marianensis TaxID=3131995 RepID=UPI0030CEF86E
MNIILSTLNAKYIHSSLALRYLKAYSEDEFPTIQICEYSINEPLMTILTNLYEKKPDVIGFSCYIWNIEETIQLIQMIKKVQPDVMVILGGPEVSYDIPYWFKRVKEIDVIVYGEGEATFKQLLLTIQAKKELEGVQGIAYRIVKGHQVNPPQANINLNDIPSPYQDDQDLATLQDKIVYFEASRGCPFSCAYCLSSIETGVRYFSVERVKRDLLRLINSGVKTIKFVDRTFNIHKRYAMEIFQFLIENHQNTVFQFEITADIMKEDVLQYLIDHAPKGVFRFEIGVQSTNDYTNSLVNRRQNFKKLSQTVLKIKETDKIDQHLDLIAGLPEEDYESFRKTFNDVFALRPEELQLGFLKMLRGTQIWYEASKYGYQYQDYAPYEILQNDVLSFEDVIRIKRLEDVLEKYWNSHRMNKTIEYLVREEFASPFDFFQEFGDYWAEKGWNRIGHQVETLFLRLLEFLENKRTKELDFIVSLMKFDYFMNFKYKPRKTWWEFEIPKQKHNEMIKMLAEFPEKVSSDFAFLRLDEKDIHKHSMMELLSFDLPQYFLSGQKVRVDTLLMIYYQPPDIAQPFFGYCCTKKTV